MKFQNEVHLGNKILRNEDIKVFTIGFQLEIQSLKHFCLEPLSFYFFVHSFEVAIMYNTHHLRSLVPFSTPKGPKFLLETIEN